jgi:MFS family permease
MSIQKKTTALRSRTIDPSAPAMSALWFGIQLTWGAVLGIALQARCTQLGGASSLALFAWVATTGAIAAAVTQLVVGPWSDRVRARGRGRGAFYLAGVVGGAFALPCFFIASTPPLLIASFMALQIALNVAIGPYQAIVPDTFPSERIAAGSAWIAAMQSGGNAAGAVLAALLGSTLRLGYVLAFVLLASAAVTLRHVSRLPKRSDGGVRVPFVMSWAFADLFISRALVYVGFYTLLGYLFFFIRATSVLPFDPTRSSGIAILAFTLVGSLGAALAARPAARMDERVVVCAGGLATALAIFILAGVHGTAVFAASLVAAGVGWGVFICADWALACRILPRHAMAGAMAVWNLAVLLPQMCAPGIASAVLVVTGTLHGPAGPPIAMAVAAAEMLAGALWIWRLPAKYVGN